MKNNLMKFNQNKSSALFMCDMQMQNESFDIYQHVVGLQHLQHTTVSLTEACHQKQEEQVTVHISIHIKTLSYN